MNFGKRFCNHCGRLYEGKRCSCRRDSNNERSRKYHDSFYNSPAWVSLSRFIRIRDFNTDRLALYFRRVGRPTHGIGINIYDFVVDATTGEIRRFPGVLVVHHIVPREDDKNLQYTENNLITLNTHVHEYIHQLYGTNKEEVQNILREAVKTELP